jgi:hypothetical protein
MAGPSAAFPRPEWLRVFRTPPWPLGGVFALHPFCFAPMDRGTKARLTVARDRFRPHDLHASGTARLPGRLFRHGNSNGIPEICAGMPPLGPRRQDRSTPQHHGGNGAGLGPARRRGRRGSLSRVAVIGCFLCVVESPPACQAKPYLRHLQQGGPGFWVMDDARHLQALRGVASILVGSPHRAPCADLPQRGSAPDVPAANWALCEIFTRRVS